MSRFQYPRLSTRAILEAYVLLRRRNGELWVTAPAGIVVLHDGRLERLIPASEQGVIRIATEDAAMLNGITGVQEARDGSLWISTLHGLVHLQSDELVHAIHERQYRLEYEVLGVEEGTPGSLLSSEQLTSQGVLWLIGSSGIGYMNVDQPFAPTRPPTVRVRELEANGTMISVAEKLTLGPHISNLEIRYAGANLANPENMIYRYRLSGMDKDWQNVGNAREAMYTNLAPGRYDFHVMAKNSGDHGVQIENSSRCISSLRGINARSQRSLLPQLPFAPYWRFFDGV